MRERGGDEAPPALWVLPALPLAGSTGGSAGGAHLAAPPWFLPISLHLSYRRSMSVARYTPALWASLGPSVPAKPQLAVLGRQQRGSGYLRVPDAERSACVPQHGRSSRHSGDRHASLLGRTRAAFRGGNSSLLPWGILNQQLPQKAPAGVRSALLPKKGTQGRWGVLTGLDLRA